jgi:hypothetical protein
MIVALWVLAVLFGALLVTIPWPVMVVPCLFCVGVATTLRDERRS